ncbi:ATPase family associated with various cellular activities (AAA) [Caballeronia cordobensis]|uniref:ATPase family associated with various cellular activities (AAA) n=1 Tax=Caballeronia cordobensis TaxID=1353886 RepID=A0A158GSK9_CABCO|nr:MoxR family ATPase [Caballeronia cordobensis]SAL34847.1 ATPase family associated with various cellular activities (AAA) [Caballeronia cordobensis]
MTTESELQDWRADALKLEDAVANAVVGQQDTIHLINVALYARGHVLLEGGVGVGKTTLLRAFARAAGGAFERIEGTIDLMPGDLIYHTFVDADGKPRIDPGPLLRHGEHLTTFFFNEINRSRPQVQSLLLRAMAERSVSAFGRDYRFPHMTVFADRNKVEKDETFELASAARDRFLFELNMPTPATPDIRRALVFDPAFHDVDTLMETVPAGVIDAARLNRIGAAIQRSVTLSASIEQYVLDIWQATETPQRYGIEIDGVDMERLILAGASPRGMSALVRAVRAHAWLDGRLHVLPEDVHAVLLPALGHRVFFTPVYEMRRQALAETLTATIVQKIAVP